MEGGSGAVEACCEYSDNDLFEDIVWMAEALLSLRLLLSRKNLVLIEAWTTLGLVRLIERFFFRSSSGIL